MKILVVSGFYFPDRAGIAPIASDFSRGMAAKKHEVTVLATHPFYPEWKRKSAASPWKVQHEVIDGVDVFRYGLYVPRNPSKLFPRLLHEGSFAISLLRSLMKGRHDAVVVFCPHLAVVLYAAIRKLFRREFTWLNVQDIPADAVMKTGLSSSGVLGRIGMGAQRLLFGAADQWSSIAPSMVERLEQLNTKNRPIHLHPNWLTGSLAELVRMLPGKLGRPVNQPIRLHYAGNIGKKQGLLDFCQFLHGTEVSFEFRINGNGAEAAAVRHWVEQVNDSRFYFGEFLNEAEFVQVLHQCDVFIITEKEGAGPSFIPSKLIPCISSGTPVLCVCDRHGPLAQEVTANNLGCVVQWCELNDDFPSCLQQLSENAGQFRTFQQSCLDRARIYNRDVALDNFERSLQATLDDPKP